MMEYQIKAGQIWREVDSRFPELRYVRVEAEPFALSLASFARTAVRTVCRDRPGAPWLPAVRSRRRLVLCERFNGRLGGYELVEDVKP